MSAAATPELELHLLGGFCLLRSGEPIAVAPAGRRLLAYVALARGPVLRGYAAAVLWPEGTDAQAGANLRSTLRRLPKPDGVSLVTAGPTHVSLPPWVGVDLWQAQARLDARPAGGDAGPHDGGEGHLDPELLQADVLPEWLEDWLVTERERHRQLRLHALERLCGEHRDEGRYDLAIRAGLTAVAGEPLRESAHRALIEVHLAEGNHAEALRQYDTYRRQLRTELGLSPSPVIRSLVAPLLGRPADAPTSAASPAPVGAPAPRRVGSAAGRR